MKKPKHINAAKRAEKQKYTPLPGKKYAQSDGIFLWSASGMITGTGKVMIMTDKILTDNKSVFQKKIKSMVAKTGYSLMTQQFVAAIATVVFYDNKEFFKKLILELMND